MKSINVLSTIRNKPHALAKIQGSGSFSNLRGLVEFYQTRDGVFVSIFVSGLPQSRSECEKPIFAMHIHNGSSCTGDEADPFADAMTHYNPDNCPHPYHAGDMPPLFGANGMAVSIFLTNRFSVEEVIGKAVIIHSGFDDFTTQPSGNSGEKIACGIIVKR